MKKIALLGLLAAALILFVYPKIQTMMLDEVVVEHARSAPAAPDTPMAGYMTITNHSDRDEILVGVVADSADFKSAEVHESFEEDGLAKMQHIEAIPLPKGESLVLKPRSYHLMLMQPQKSFSVGDAFTVTLKFKSGHTIDVPISIVPRDQIGGMSGHSH